MQIVDMRSDTVTVPTDEMRKAMASAVVGDDVYGEDATVNKLQQQAASKMGKEAGLFVPSGTMGNLIAVLAHCQRGDEVIMGHLGHTFLFEGGGVSALGGVVIHTVRNQPDGTLSLDEIVSAIRPNDIHHPISKLVILENTHNRCGGVILSKEYMDSVGKLCEEHNLILHLDGARIFNATVALGVEAHELTKSVDSVTFCLSKGLCAPVGSVLCGSSDFINRARRIRKMLGGGMRQAGVLAAAGLVALDSMIDRLAEDHRKASRLAKELSQIPGIAFEMGIPQTNMVFPSLTTDVKLSTSEFVKKIAERGIKIGVVGEKRFRLVTHYWVTDEGVDRTIQAFSDILG